MLPAVGLEVEQPRGLEDAREGVDLEGDLVQVGDGVRHVAVLPRVCVIGADADHPAYEDISGNQLIAYQYTYAFRR